ncbi:flippase [Acetivibrio clariflavus]|mgnify:CR=1 FL=1|uniref:Membrane protein involved in the export of O-antigen and teichoic acid n=1 Tax=Acetivibrio clariflavus (strain DSM 19732 / NBRC 101661 / EBR45) TaxID=720554 RepID=G8M351_ACECE|nr:flippase [Acetivibrio clariflavus]AEV69360.1 membrane protein involved in the export of O-antigen and teichoic acid [Acetivibrio clariflavus DSM 19732]
MSKTSIKKNFAYQMLYEILILILPFITSPYIARVIGAEGLGKYSYSYSVAYYFVLFSMLGLKNYGNRVIAQKRNDQTQLNETFSNLLAVHILISILCCIAYVFYIWNLKDDKLFALIQGTYVLSGLFDISWFYFGIEKFKLTVTRDTIIKIINVLCVFIFVKTSDDLWKYCLIMALGMLISQLFLWIPLKRYVQITRPQLSKMTIHIKPLFILFIPAIAVSLYKYMDKIMIGYLSNKVQLGYYENAEKVTNIPLTVITSFGVVMLPKMSNLVASKNREATFRYISLSMKYVMCLAFALAFGLAGVGNVFAPVFWGEDFRASGIIIMGLSITVPFISFANVIRTQYLIPNEKDKEYLLSVISGAVVNLIINFLCIPSLGAIGATIGTVAAEATVCLIQVFAVWKELPLITYIKNSFLFILTGITMFTGVLCIGIKLETGILTLFIQILFGACFYSIICGFYFYYTKDEIFMNILQVVMKKTKSIRNNDIHKLRQTK